MNQLRRRPLKKNDGTDGNTPGTQPNPPQQGQPGQQSSPAQQPQAPRPNQPRQQQQPRNNQPRQQQGPRGNQPRGQQGPSGNQPQGRQGNQGNRNQNQMGPRGQNQNQNQNNNQRGPNRGGNFQRRRPEPPRPAPYFQRDILLVLAPEKAEGVNAVRAKHDPLFNKMPPHITLVFSEPSAKIPNAYIETLDPASLPSLKALSFTNIVISDEKYLWLMPDEESSQKIKAWRASLTTGLNLPEQAAEEYVPHLTLGFLPRSAEKEAVLEFAKSLIATPLELEFTQILLEEFSENQLSKSILTKPLV